MFRPIIPLKILIKGDDHALVKDFEYHLSRILDQENVFNSSEKVKSINFTSPSSDSFPNVVVKIAGKSGLKFNSGYSILIIPRFTFYVNTNWYVHVQLIPQHE